jgi:hypothetical protein
MQWYFENIQLYLHFYDVPYFLYHLLFLYFLVYLHLFLYFLYHLLFRGVLYFLHHMLCHDGTVDHECEFFQVVVDKLLHKFHLLKFAHVDILLVLDFHNIVLSSFF